jgi:hypothetical protein
MVPLEEALSLLDRMHEAFYARLPTEEISSDAVVGRMLA